MSQADSALPSVTLNACPRCGGSSASPFVAAGVCLRCAGERVLALDSGSDLAVTPALSDVAPARVTGGDLPLQIGPYEIIDEIGRGGMGRVFAARQAGLGRIVALKALSEGRGGAAGLELRFLREAQTVARLRHPHLVSVHDSGRADGHVFFTMDYFESGDLARRLRERPLVPREAAALAHKIATALAYTHAEGVLHRDVKPSNILLDGDEPRLADFGLAAQLEPGGDLTVATGVLGTPHYVAPEALAGGSAALAAASDQYALGVVLYEMLTGRTPYAGAAPAELAQLVDAAEPPPPRLLAPAVPRELETICLRCLEREPARRYAGTAALAEDLRRFLADEPILTPTPGRWAAARKFARRYRGALVATTAIAAVLIAATAVSATLAVRARRAELAAAEEAAKAKALVEFLENDLLGQAAPGTHPEQGVTLRTVVDLAAKRLDGKFPDRPLVAAQIHAVLAGVYDALGDYPTARGHAERTLALRRTVLKDDDPPVLAAMSVLGSVLHDLGKHEEAERVLAPALAGRQRVLGHGHADTVFTGNLRAIVLRELGRMADAGALQVETLAAGRKTLRAPHALLARGLSTLATIRWRERKLAEAEALAKEAAEMLQQLHGPEHLDTLSARSDLAVVYRDRGQTAAALAINEQVLAVRRRVLPAGHPHTLNTMNNLAGILKDLDRYVEAEAIQRETLEQLIRAPGMGEGHPRTLGMMRNLADTYRLQKRYDEAAELLGKTLAISRRSLTDTHPATLGVIASLADVHLYQGKPEQALPLFREAWAGYAKSQLGGARLEAIRSKLGHALALTGHFEEAEPLLVGSYEFMTKPGVELPAGQKGFVREAGEQIVELYRAWGRPERAAEWEARLRAK